MGLAIDPHAIHDYIPDAYKDKPTTEQAIFKLGVLTTSERASVFDEANIPGRRAQAAIRAADMGLRGWVNFRNDEGKNLPYPTKGDKRPIDFLHFNLALEIGAAVKDLNTPGEDDLGKSKPASG